MDQIERVCDRVSRCLDGSLEAPEIRVGPGFGLQVLVSITSQTFEGMDEGDRQEIVWGRLLPAFNEDEIREIEFIYTDAPSELAEEPAGSPTP